MDFSPTKFQNHVMEKGIDRDFKQWTSAKGRKNQTYEVERQCIKERK